MQDNMAKFVRREEDNLPIKIEIATGRTRTKTGALVADSNTIVLEFGQGVEVINLANNQTLGVWLETSLKKRFEVSLGQG